MEAIVSALPYAEIILVIGIVLQQRGATLGGAFGGDNFASTFYKRRGAEKFLFNALQYFRLIRARLAVIWIFSSGYKKAYPSGVSSNSSRLPELLFCLCRSTKLTTPSVLGFLSVIDISITPHTITRTRG